MAPEDARSELEPALEADAPVLEAELVNPAPVAVVEIVRHKTALTVNTGRKTNRFITPSWLNALSLNLCPARPLFGADTKVSRRARV